MTREKQDRFALRFPVELVGRIQAFADRKMCNFNEAVRQLVLAGLDAEVKGRRLSTAERDELDKLLAATGAEDYPSALRMARRSVAAVNHDAPTLGGGGEPVNDDAGGKKPKRRVARLFGLF